MAEATPAEGMPAFDLVAPTNLLVSTWQPLLARHLQLPTGFDVAKAQREAREREERVARETETALAEWQAFRSRNADNPVALAALDIHQPEAGYDSVVCSVCKEHNGYEDTQQVEWPCVTYAEMNGAADGADAYLADAASLDLAMLEEESRRHLQHGLRTAPTGEGCDG